MSEYNIRLLRAEEIEVRVGSIHQNGISLLLYKSARVDMTVLDETFGMFNWTRHHKMIGDVMFCEVAIKDPDTGDWVAKSDAGTASYSEPEKGAASDSFKRACTCIGIGRELYTAPFIWVPEGKVTISEYDGKKTVKDSFRVKDISYSDDRQIAGLVIVNQKDEMVFSYGSSFMKGRNANVPVEKLSANQVTAILTELRRTGISLSSVLKKYKLMAINEMAPELYDKAMHELKETPDKVA